MSKVCERCYKIVDSACQSDAESADCQNLRRTTGKRAKSPPDLDYVREVLQDIHERAEFECERRKANCEKQGNWRIIRIETKRALAELAKVQP